MKLGKLAGFLAALLLVVAVSSCSEKIHQTDLPQIVGGFSKSPVSDEDVMASAKFAVKAREEILKKDNKSAKVELIEIIDSSKQVVAGMNYKMNLKVRTDGKEETVEVVVWKKLDGGSELTDWKKK